MTEAEEKKSLKRFSLESGKKDHSMLEKHKEWVLSAIEQIRQRKARPDFPKLCNTLQRKHGLDKSEIQTCIDQLIQEKAIRKVFFKGQCSYRSNKLGSANEVSPLSTGSRIVYGIKSIMKQTGDGVCFQDLENWLISRNPETKLVKTRLEVALKREIEANTITKLSDNCYVLTESLPTKEKKEETPVVQKVSPPLKRISPTENSRDTVSRRPGRPRRKLSMEGNKYSEDPDYEVPQSYRQKKMEKPVCDFCQKPADNRDKKKFLLICKDCDAKAHPSCMNYSEELAAKARNSPWQCIDCKVCFVCNEAGDDDHLLFCDSCDKGYHMTCHNPQVNNQPKGKWVCSRCKLEKKSPPGCKDTVLTSIESSSTKKDSAQSSKASSEVGEQDPVEVDFSVSRRGRKRKIKEDFGEFIGLGFKRRSSLNQTGSTISSLNQSGATVSSLEGSITEITKDQSRISEFTDGTEGASCLPTPGASPNHHSDTFDYQLKMSESVISLHINDTATYPNASKWSTDEVVQYFTDLGFKDEAKAFREQEIDGRSLLLMKRNDVLTGLAIRLGPALKIYQKIYKLQTVGQINS